LEGAASELAELRHDLLVARALLEEEEARVEALNTRRAMTLAEDVPFLIFRRPRTVSASRVQINIPLQHVLRVDPLPACLEDDEDAPEPLRAMIDLLQDAPIAWFPEVEALLDLWTSKPQLEDFIRNSADMYADKPKKQMQVHGASLDATPFGKTLQTVIGGYQSWSIQERSLRPGLFTELLRAPTWIDLRKRAPRLITLEHLQSGRHGYPAAKKKAGEMLDGIQKVAACVYRQAREVPAVIRLRWAETISQFDAPVRLDDPSWLPRWTEVPRERREHLAVLIRWLHQRVAKNEQDAKNWMSDLVRVAILTASHAPVNRIIEADVLEPKRPFGKGSFIPVKLDPRTARIGAEVMLLDELRVVVAKGRVDDVTGSGARVEVTYTREVQVTAVKVQMEPPRPTRHMVDVENGVGVSFLGVSKPMRK
jgi:hypothetical protein